MTLAATADSPVARRLGTLAVGLVLVGVGVAVTIRAEIGVAPYDVLTTGLVALTGMPIGLAAMLLPLGFVIIGLLIGGRPGPGTILAVLLVGPILGVVLDALPMHEAMPVRLLFFVARVRPDLGRDHRGRDLGDRLGARRAGDARHP